MSLPSDSVLPNCFATLVFRSNMYWAIKTLPCGPATELGTRPSTSVMDRADPTSVTAISSDGETACRAVARGDMRSTGVRAPSPSSLPSLWRLPAEAAFIISSALMSAAATLGPAGGIGGPAAGPGDAAGLPAFPRVPTLAGAGLAGLGAARAAPSAASATPLPAVEDVALVVEPASGGVGSAGGTRMVRSGAGAGWEGSAPALAATAGEGPMWLAPNIACRGETTSVPRE